MLYKKYLLPLLLFALLLTWFPVQTVQAETIAVHPFQADNKEIAEIFSSVLNMELFMVPGSYSVYSIGTDDWPLDVPVGGFPAYICPSPSLTMGLPYAITGEVFNDPDFSGSYRLKLYLWDMKEKRLLVHDELTARDRESCEKQMKYLLAWLLSWVGREEQVPVAVPVPEPVRAEAPAQAEKVVIIREQVPQTMAAFDRSRWNYIGPKGGEETTPVDNPDKWVYLGPEREKWLYLGARAGMGSSQWYYDQNNPFYLKNQDTSDFLSANLSMQLSFHVMRYLDIQTEANFTADFGSLGDSTSGTVKNDGVFINWSLTVPLLLKLNLRGSHVKAGIFGGAYFYLPLFQTNADKAGDYFDYKPDIPGFIFGMSLGWKAGPGYLFLDGRLEFDGQWRNSGRDQFYYRNMTKINLGYEVGFINKKAK